MMRRKPTGKIGPVSVTARPTGPTMKWSAIEFPPDKERVEQIALDLFVAAGKKIGFSFREINRNAENHFDYTIELPGGRIFLDLAEVLYVDQAGQPYVSREKKIMTYRYAEQIYTTVMKKSDHYGRANTTPIHLLTYITHWRFQPNEIAIRLAQHFLQQTPPVMENVFLLLPLDGNEAELRSYIRR
jgi:hypothetical protein